MGLTAKRPDEFVIRGTAAAIERMGPNMKMRPSRWMGSPAKSMPLPRSSKAVEPGV